MYYESILSLLYYILYINSHSYTMYYESILSLLYYILYINSHSYTMYYESIFIILCIHVYAYTCKCMILSVQYTASYTAACDPLLVM